jgi:hypothetical protein
MRSTTALVTVGSVALALAAGGCGGGGQKKQDTTPEVSGGGHVFEGDPCSDPCNGGMCPPETLDAIQRALASKRRAAARCLSDAVNDGKISKDAHGHVALTFVIGKNGKARSITVSRSSIKNPEVEQCVVAEVQQINFGDLPIDLDWSYTYAFESM